MYNNILYSRMNCDLCSAEIHEGFKDFEESCPFCHEQFENRKSNEREQSCDNAYEPSSVNIDYRRLDEKK